MAQQLTDFKIYENTLFFSIADKAEGDDNPIDFALSGNGERLAAGLGCLMIRHPELAILFETALHCYAGLMANGETNKTI